MSKPKVRVERIGDGEYEVAEYGPRNSCRAVLFTGDIAEAQDYARDYADDCRAMASRSED